MNRPRVFGRVALSLLLAGAAPLVAHPGVGIVMDQRGSVFYTDLARVWKIGRASCRERV